MIDFVVFTMVGRELLFQRTVQQLQNLRSTHANRLIIAADGRIDIECLMQAKPDLILMSGERRGYIGSITDALRLVKSDYFLWIEDDWTLDSITSDQVDQVLGTLAANPAILQVRWSKSTPLPHNWPVIDGPIRHSFLGFSANPNISRTALVKDGFEHILNLPTAGNRLGIDGFEDVLSDWAEQKGYVCAVYDPKDRPSVHHTGYLESTGRGWHMTSSVKKKPVDYGYLGVRPPLWRRIWMAAKLAKVLALIAPSMLVRDDSYEFAFRIVSAQRGTQWRSSE